LLAAAIVTTVVGGAIWLGYASPVVRLDTVSVKGTSRLSAGEVLAAARVRIGGSLLSVPTEEIRRRVARLAPVASVRVTRAWPHGLVITVTERTPVATVASGAGRDGVVLLLDAQGVAFAETPPSTTSGTAGDSGGLVDLRVAAPALGATTPAAVAALRVWSGLPPAVRHEVRWMSADAADDVSFSLARGATVVWGSAGDGPDKLAVLVSLLRRPAATYDVSTPGIAVTR
jgi:cell division protein FtsQ